MKQRSLLQLIAIMMVAILGTSVASCGSDDDEPIAPETPNEQPDSEPPFVVRLYNFERGIGANLSAISLTLKSESIEGARLCERVTNADSSIYKSIEYERYPTSGQAAQGIKEITVVLADEYPATTEQLIEYLQRHHMISEEEDVWKFSNSVDPDKQKFILTFTASARKLVYTYVNEPLFLDFSQYLGTDIRKVGWGSIDGTGNFLTYTPHGLRDGYVWEVHMFADSGYDNKVKSVTVQFELDLEYEKADSIIQYLNRIYIYYGMWEEKHGYGYNYYNEEKTMIITYRVRHNMNQKNRAGVIHTGELHEVLYSPYK